MGLKAYLLLALLVVVLIAILIGVELFKNNDEASVEPKSLAMTFKGDPRTSRAFTWYTNNPDTGAVLQIAKGSDIRSFDGKEVMTFAGKSAKLDTGKSGKQGVHKAEATGLEPGTEYSYRVGNGSDNGWSEPAVFATEAAAHAGFTFINVTDSQGVTAKDFELWSNTLDKAFATFPGAEFIVHNGDLTENPEDEQAWDAFFGKARKWLTRLPLMPVTGNHDEADGKADRFVSHFNVSANGAEGSIPGTSYSFDYGDVHFVVMNTESNMKAQTKWLQTDLAGTDKPWKIVALHRGPYAGNMYEKVQDWVSVFDEFGVDLVLQGHNHEYSRSFPLRGGRKAGEGEGAVYVVTNTSGQKFNKKKDDLFYHKVHFQNGRQMFAGITIEGKTLTYQAYDVAGNMLDEFAIRHR
ncbi:metallophosphoesterase family protein [Paenibacillus hemerocallicola]|uniref:Metallophosphoesterase family protein n=1 Tax=Paenibacillus hemerocallicola TaxID=1172614 RepID=A0A5C4T225_9BACL|nr:metallophosphoesterase family protein [Paenibacillus hemerocallicola]TNJ63101.1 metallophosphoesterase family protein [Paenibacillus hemerocallicola]